MAEFIIEQNLDGFSDDKDALSEAVVKMQKSLSWLLAHLDSRNVQSINTNLTEVKSEDGATRIDGALLRMLDAKGRLRALFGKDDAGNFIFEIYDKKGNTAIHLDEDGSAVFSGNIEGANIKGANIEGSNIRVAPNEYRDYITLENDGVNDILGLYYGGARVGGMRLLDAGAFEIFGSKISIGSSSGTVSIQSGASGTFTAGDKTVTVEKGVITSIL